MRLHGKALLIGLCLLLLSGCEPRLALDTDLLRPAAGVVGGDGQLLFAPDLGQVINALEPEDVPLTVSPDGQYLLVARPSDLPQTSRVKGPASEQVRLDFLHARSGRRRGPTMALITVARWSPAGNLLAVVSGDQACLLDLAASSMLYPGDPSLPVTDLGWSPDGSKLYLWHPGGLPSVHDLGSNASSVADVFYRQPIDTERYLGMKREVRNGQANTQLVLIDRAGATTQTLPAGEIMAAQGKALLLSTNHGFGLRLLPDVDHPGESLAISEGEYVYQARFLPDERLAYTTSIDDPLRNQFRLTIAAYSGQEIGSFDVSGAEFVLAPDGSSLFVAGPEQERVLTEAMQLSAAQRAEGDGYAGRFAEQHGPEILAAVRRAAKAYYSVKLGGQSALPEGVFGRSYDLRLTADLDLARQLSMQRTGLRNKSRAKWPVEIGIKLKRYHYAVPAAASVVVQIEARNSQGVQESAEFYWELRPLLSLVQGRNANPTDGEPWAVVGIGTFYGTETEQAVRSQVQSLLPTLADGQLFSGRLRGLELAVGQVQFLAADAKTPAADLEQASYACATLLHGRPEQPAGRPAWETEDFAVGRLLLHRGDGEWRVVDLIR